MLRTVSVSVGGSGSPVFVFAAFTHDWDSYKLKITYSGQAKKKIMEEKSGENKTDARSGLWGWIVVALSTALALPTSLLKPKAPSMAEESQNNLPPFKWTNPLTWISNFSVAPSDGHLANPTTFLDTVELAEYYGYESERHKVTTEDGYILELHRLRGRRVTEVENKQDTATPRLAILIHHAFLTTSREFLLLGPKKALAFILADEGYDVWLCNVRGNTYSRSHTTLKPSQKEFWNFTYHEHGTQDLPATINYVLKENGGSKLHYMGHSMGTVSFFIMASERPDMLNKIRTFTAMGAVRTTTDCRSTILRLLMSTAKLTVGSMNHLGMYEFLPHYSWLTYAGQTICNNGRMTQKICTDLFIYPLGGWSTSMNENIIPEMLAHTPSGTSTKTLSHFSQSFRTGEFRQFDYGEKGNLERYHTKSPPLYNYQAVTVPTQIFYGMNDLMADFKEAEFLCKNLPNVFKCEKVPDDTFSHLDFIWSDKAHILVYQSILQGIKKFEDSRETEKESFLLPS